MLWRMVTSLQMRWAAREWQRAEERRRIATRRREPPLIHPESIEAAPESAPDYMPLPVTWDPADR